MYIYNFLTGLNVSILQQTFTWKLRNVLGPSFITGHNHFPPHYFRVITHNHSTLQPLQLKSELNKWKLWAFGCERWRRTDTGTEGSFPHPYLQEGSRIRLFERLYAELKQTCSVLKLASACRHLVLQSSQLHLLVLSDEIQQFLFASVDRLDQSVALCRHLILKIRTVLLQATTDIS